MKSTSVAARFLPARLIVLLVVAGLWARGGNVLVGSASADATSLSRHAVRIRTIPSAEADPTEGGVCAEDKEGVEIQPAQVPATQPSARVSDDARQLLDQLNSAYAPIKSLRLEGTISVDIRIPNEDPQHHSAHFDSTFVAPNKFRHEVKDDVLIGCTGQKLYTFHKEDNAYSLAEAPKERVASKDLPKALVDLLELQDPSLLLAVTKVPADELLSDVTDASKTDDSTIDSNSCPTLKLQQKDKSVVQVALDPQKHLVRRMTIDMTAPLKKRRDDLTNAVLVIDYAKTAADEDAKDELFAWSPPPGAKDADAMAAAEPSDEMHASQLLGKSAPTFKLEGLDGKSIALADLKGSVVVLDFWATWCGPCRASLPHLDKLYQREKDKDVKVFAVNQQEARKEVQAFVDETKLGVPVLLDSDGKVGNQYGVSGIPQTVVIGKDGLVKRVLVGFGDSTEEELQKAVNAALR